MRFLLCLLALPAAAQEVAQVPYAPLTRELSEVIDFESFPSQLSPGLNHDTVLEFPGARIGERFAGQSAVTEAGFDRLQGATGGPLTVLPGDAGRNLSVTHIYFLSNQVQGLAAPGFPAREAGGEGAVAIVFEQDQRALGFRVSAEIRPETPTPKGVMTVTFHARDGRVIERRDVPLEWGRNGYGFRRSGNQADIAGVTIENRDPGGIAIDDIVFDLLRAGT